MSKIVVLNSGGFDSIVLMNYLHTIKGLKEIHSLHFLYGAKNEKQQLECVNKVCEKLGAVNKVITLPRIDWTKNDFYDDSYGYETQYLEYRNLIFIAYAMSYAESIGAKDIYLAILNSQGYADTKLNFLEGINSFSYPNSDILVVAPFINDDKEVLMHIASYLGITEDDYFSCDVPNGDSPCGVCDDCEYLKELSDKIIRKG